MNGYYFRYVINMGCYTGNSISQIENDLCVRRSVEFFVFFFVRCCFVKQKTIQSTVILLIRLETHTNKYKVNRFYNLLLVVVVVECNV